MDAGTAVARAKELADQTLAPDAARCDKEGRFSTQAVTALGRAGLLGLTAPSDAGGAALGARAFADTTTPLAEADASVAMVFVMHVLGTVTIAAAPRTPQLRQVLADIAAGQHLTTLAFSEPGSRSHFWAPVSRAVSADGAVELTARKSWVTSAGCADSYVVSSQSPEGAGVLDSTIYLVPARTPGLTVAGVWDGLGLRANASAPMSLDRCRVPSEFRLTPERGGFGAMIDVVLPWFNVGCAAVALGICRATVKATAAHLTSTRLEHLNTTLGEALPTLRAQLAGMQIETTGLAARLDHTLSSLEHPNGDTMLRVLELKAAAGEAAIQVTSAGMRACGGAAFSKHTSIERNFRDAHAGAVMAPTGDVLREFIGRAVLGLPLF
jgi:alkylation response protein AidB-like acyl-CoA dehydrogenase